MIHIRPAVAEDAAIIRSLAETTWWDTYGPILSDEQIRFMLDYIYDPAKIARQIGDGSQVYLLLSDDERPLGFAAYAPRTEDPEVYKLHKLYCLPETKGRGLGRMLLQEVERRVLAQGKNALELNVNKYNPAKGFYEKMGYAVIYEEDIPIGEYWMNDYVMRKVL